MQAPQRPGFFNGFGGSMWRGLMLGGLIGLLLGHGFGGLAGLFGLLLQALLIGGVILLFFRLFRSQSAASPAPGAGIPAARMVWPIATLRHAMPMALRPSVFRALLPARTMRAGRAIRMRSG